MKGADVHLSDDDKRELLRNFCDALKSVRGVGPKNIYAKYYDKEVHVHFEGSLSQLEKQLVKHFKEEALEVLVSFYKRGANIAYTGCLRSLKEKHNLEYNALEIDFERDSFIYKMREIDHSE